jgi:Tfp pilus assembly protein PilX
MKPCGMLKDQKGAVLVIAVVMLLILSIIGIYAVGSSTIEIKISGQKKFHDAAFNAADAGIDYVRADNPFGTIDSTNPQNFDSSSCPDINFSGTVSYLGNSPPPTGSGTGQRVGFQAHYHLIDSIGTDTLVALSNASVNLQAEGYRIGF